MRSQSTGRARGFALLCLGWLCFAQLCSALFCFALLCFAFPCLALPCLACLANLFVDQIRMHEPQGTSAWDHAVNLSERERRSCRHVGRPVSPDHSGYVIVQALPTAIVWAQVGWIHAPPCRRRMPGRCSVLAFLLGVAHVRTCVYTRDAYIWARWVAPAAVRIWCRAEGLRMYNSGLPRPKERERERALHLFSHTGLRAGAARTSPTNLESTTGLALRPWTPSLYWAGRSAQPLYPTGAQVAHMLPGPGE